MLKIMFYICQLLSLIIYFWPITVCGVSFLSLFITQYTLLTHIKLMFRAVYWERAPPDYGAPKGHGRPYVPCPLSLYIYCSGLYTGRGPP